MFNIISDHYLQEIIDNIRTGDQWREDDDWFNHESHDIRYLIYYDVVFPLPLYMGSTITGLFHFFVIVSLINK